MFHRRDSTMLLEPAAKLHPIFFFGGRVAAHNRMQRTHNCQRYAGIRGLLCDFGLRACSLERHIPIPKPAAGRILKAVSAALETRPRNAVTSTSRFQNYFATKRKLEREERGKGKSLSLVHTIGHRLGRRPLNLSSDRLHQELFVAIR